MQTRAVDGVCSRLDCSVSNGQLTSPEQPKERHQDCGRPEVAEGLLDHLRPGLHFNVHCVYHGGESPGGGGGGGGGGRTMQAGTLKSLPLFEQINC